LERRDAFVDAMLNNEMKRLNAHLPKKRKTLKELLSEDRPSVSTIRGDDSSFKKNELEKLSHLAPGEDAERVTLPFVFMRRLDLGPGAYELLGDPFEQYVLAKLAGSSVERFDDFKKSVAVPFVFYRPQIVDLMGQIHSLIVLGFALSGT
jgi:uncharacterized protein (UPF0216 family)